jgi:hypothetical protein
LKQRSCAQPAQSRRRWPLRRASRRMVRSHQLRTGRLAQCPVAPALNRAAGAHRGLKPGIRVPRRFLTEKLVRGLFRLSSGVCTGPPDAVPGHTRVFTGASAHSLAQPDENWMQVSCFKEVLLPTNFVEVFRLI